MKTGKISESILKRSVLKNIKNKREEIKNGAGVGADCAIFAPMSQAALASCMQEAAVAIKAAVDSAGQSEMVSPGRGIGEPVITMGHLLQRCSNNLAARGAEPIAAMITLLLPETAEEALLKLLMMQAEQAAEEQKLQIAGGQTRVSAAVSVPYAVVTGYGKLPEGQNASGQGGKAGQDIVITKWIGLEGTAMLAQARREQLLERYPAYLVNRAAAFDRYLSVLPEAQTAIRLGASAMHDASYGGIFAALWELAEQAGTGLTVDLKRLPLRQETVEVCECCQVNPYELLSGGSMVIACKDGPALVDALEADGIAAAVAGKLTDSKDRIVCNEEEIRYMDRPRTDEIYTHL